MASYKEPHTTRPLSQSRPTTATTPSSSVPARHATARNHSHSVSLGTFNATHRVTRRKSMTSNAANNIAAVAAAISGYDGASLGALVSSDGRPSIARPNGGRLGHDPITTAQAALGKTSRYTTVDQQGMDHLNVSDEVMEDDSTTVYGNGVPEQNKDSSKARARRASEGAYLTKTDGKRASGELRCEKCGKGYKHSSCLSKHLWEHTPEWSYTSKLLISKHQQVQLLEAAQVLVTMNQDAVPAAESAKASDSDNSSASPVPFTPSDPDDDDEVSSVETSPPPTSEQADFTSYDELRNAKRYSNNSSVFSRSYQSAPSTSFAPSSVPTAASYGSFRQFGYQRRPSTPGISALGHGASEEDTALAAAVELCHFNGTPRTGPTLMDDIPPVPPLPARYASHNAHRPVSGTGYLGMQDLGLPPPLTHRLSDERSSKVHHNVPHATDDDEEYFDQRSVSRGRSDEDDDGVFGRMEE
ncbi:hypothetical protein MMC26_003456 [Xylographa opegraphella]|nr:hypothetical protein [Xylographa opegraphella]